MDIVDDLRSELPDLGVELNPLDGKKLQMLQILEYFMVHCNCNDHKAGVLPNESVQTFMEWLKLFNPEKDLVDNVWLKKVTDSRDFRLMVKRIKKEPEYAAYFANIIAKRKDGYNSNMENTVKNDEDDDDVEVEADSLFLEDEDMAYRILGIKSPFKCVECFKTNCSPTETLIRFSSSPITLAKLFTLLVDDRKLSLNNILVLGSGIGSVTFCTYLFVKGSKILSCEWDQPNFTVQNGVVKKHGMDDRVTVHNDFLPCDAGIIKSMDLVIGCEDLLLSTKDKQRETVFITLRKCMKSGSRLVLFQRLADWLPVGNNGADWTGDEELCGGDEKHVNSNMQNFEDWLLLEHKLCFTNDESFYYHVYKVL